MGTIKRMFGWVGRRVVVYLLIVLALVAAAVLTPWVRSEWTNGRAADARLEALGVVEAQVELYEKAAADRFEETVRTMRGASVAAIDGRLAAARERRARLIGGQPTQPIALRLALGGPGTVLADQRREVDIALAAREITSLERARTLAQADARLVAFRDLNARAAEADRLRPACRAAGDAIARFDRQWLGQRLWNRDDRERLVAARTDRCRRSAQADRTVRAEIAARREAIALQRQASAAYETSTTRLAGSLTLARVRLERQIRDDEATLRGSLFRRGLTFAERIDLAGKLKTAALILLGIVLMPYGVRLLFYFVLAPIAQRRASIRLRVPGGAGAAIALAAPSTTSVAMRLAQGEELLVRQDYLQSTPATGTARTRFVLDRRHPFTSLATGLTFLTRIRGDGEFTNVSAVRDPIAEVTVLTLPDGGACVLQPRALAAVAQPIGRLLRVTSHWRLFTLSAWLTLQLRYLVFHGPARLVVKGGRGVRVENATHGRVFGQHQLVGFSSDLAYSVTRTETFWPYFLGREPLLKDKVEQGGGVLIIEEAPMAGRRANGARSGLEGAVDAGMKLFGM